AILMASCRPSSGLAVMRELPGTRVTASMGTSLGADRKRLPHPTLVADRIQLRRSNPRPPSASPSRSGGADAVPTDRCGLDVLLEAGDQWPAPCNGRLDRRQRQRSLVACLAVPDLGDPDCVGIRRILRDNITQASGHP